MTRGWGIVGVGLALLGAFTIGFCVSRALHERPERPAEPRLLWALADHEPPGRRLGRRDPPRPERRVELAPEELDAILAHLPQHLTDVRWNRGVGEFHPAVGLLRDHLRQGGAMSDEQWRRLLVDSGTIRLHERWPADEPYTVTFDRPSWLDWNELRLEPRRAGWKEARISTMFGAGGLCGMVWMELLAQERQELGALPLGRHSLVFDVTLDAEPGNRWSGPITVDVEVVDDMDAAIPPVSSPALDAAVARSLGLRFLPCEPDFGHPRTKATLFLAPGRDERRRLEGTAVSVEVEVLRDGVTLERKHLVIGAASGTESLHDSAFLRLFPGGPDPCSSRIVDDAAERARWSFRVRGVARGLLSTWGATQRWAGDVTVSAEEALRRARANVRGLPR